MQALIIAGGFGTRMKSLLGDIPKSLALIQKDFFIQLQMNWLKDASSIHFCLGYKSSEILDVLGRSQAGITSFSTEKKPLGVIGSIYNALPYLEDTFAVLLGDVLPRIPFIDFLKQCTGTFLEGKGILFLAPAANISGQKGNIKLLSKGRIAYSKEPSFLGNKVDIGFWIFPKLLIKQYGNLSHEEPFFQTLIKNDLLIGIEVPERSWEIGSLDGLNELQESVVLCGK